MKTKKKIEVSDDQYADLMYLVESIHKVGFYLNDPEIDTKTKKEFAKAIKLLNRAGEVIDSVVEIQE